MAMILVPAPRSSDEITREWADELMPPGTALRGPNVRALLGALAVPHEALEGDIAAISREICPGTSDRLLDDYRTLLGPDPLGRDSGVMSDDAWRYVLEQRWTARGDQRPAFYIQLAKSYGVDITIIEPEPPICGAAVCGAAVCGQETLRFTWIVELPSAVLRAICGVAVCGTVEAGQDETNGYSELIRVFRLLRPADTEVYFISNGIWIDG